MAESAHLKQLVELYEQDRRLAAFDLHDGLAQYVAAALMHFEASAQFRPTDAARADSEFDQGLARLRKSLDEARRLIAGRAPPLLEEQGLIAALESLVDEVRPTGLSVELTHRLGAARLAPPLESALLRIVQEALTNVRDHSRSPRALVELVQTDGRVRVTIQDWGVGFDPDKMEDRRFGLRGIRERARLLGGQASIDSRPGQGTTITADLPVVTPLEPSR